MRVHSEKFVSPKQMMVGIHLKHYMKLKITKIIAYLVVLRQSSISANTMYIYIYILYICIIIIYIHTMYTDICNYMYIIISIWSRKIGCRPSLIAMCLHQVVFSHLSAFLPTCHVCLMMAASNNLRKVQPILATAPFDCSINHNLKIAYHSLPIHR